MPEYNTARCEECGIEKKDSNHWFGMTTYDVGLTIWSWRYRVIGDPVYCGEKCLTKALSQWLEKQPK